MQTRVMRLLSVAVIILFMLFISLQGCSSKPDIKDDFCGIHINYQYCKCAFHNEYCNAVRMSKSEAKTYVYAEYNKWVDSLNPSEKESEESKESDEEKYGVIEKDGNLYLNSKPGEVLEIKTKDLPKWARNQIATVGASIAVVGPPDSIVEGDSSVLLDGLPIARVGDATAHGGSIVEGSKKIFVNGQPVAIIGGQAADPTVVGTVPAVGGPIVSNK